MLKPLLAIAAICILADRAAAAPLDQMSWTYVEAGAYQLDTEPAGRLDGFAIRGAAAVEANVHVFGAFERSSTDDAIDLDQWRVGAGYHTPVTKWADLYLRVAYERIQIEEIVDGSGWGFEAGLRALVAPRLEISAGARQQRIEDDTRTSGLVAAHYRLNDTWGIVADATMNGDFDAWLVGLRASF